MRSHIVVLREDTLGNGLSLEWMENAYKIFHDFFYIIEKFLRFKHKLIHLPPRYTDGLIFTQNSHKNLTKVEKSYSGKTLALLRQQVS